MWHWLFLGALGSLLVENSFCAQDVTMKCRNPGIIQMEAGTRYKLDFQAAVAFCESHGYTLATLQQLKWAHASGYESCRYGWIQDGLVALPRVHAHPSCRKNLIGIYTDSWPQNLKFDTFCFTGTDDKNCVPDNSHSATSTGSPHLQLTENYNLPTVSRERMAMSSLTTTESRSEYTSVESAKDPGSFMDTEPGAESPLSTIGPRSVESDSHSSDQMDHRSTAESSLLVLITQSSSPEQQLSSLVRTESPALTGKLSTSSTRIGHMLHSHSGSPGPGSNPREVLDGSGSAAGGELYTETTSLPLRGHKPEDPFETDLPTTGITALPLISTLLPDLSLHVMETTGAELQAHPIKKISLTTEFHGTKSKPDMGFTSIWTTASPFHPTSDSSRTPSAGVGKKLNNELIREVSPTLEFTKVELNSGAILTTTVSTASTSPPDVLLDNSLGYNTEEYLLEDESNSLDFPTTPKDLTTFQVNAEDERENLSGVATLEVHEITERPIIFGTHQAGMSSVPMTSNLPDLPEESANSSQIFGSKILLDQQATGTTGGAQESSGLPSPADLSMEIGSTQESSGLTDLFSEFIATAVSEATQIPSHSPFPESKVPAMDSRSTSVILPLEPMEVLLDYSTGWGSEIEHGISVSPESTVLFVESGSTPDMTSSGPAVESSSEFTTSTESAAEPTSEPPTTDSTLNLSIGTTPQAGEAAGTPSGAATSRSSTTSTEEPLVSTLRPSPEGSSIVPPATAGDVGQSAPSTSPTPHTTAPSEHLSPASADTARTSPTPVSGSTASSLLTSRAHQIVLSTVGQQQKAQPNFPRASEPVILDEKIRGQPATTAVGEKPPAAPLDWLIVAAIIVSLLIILIGGVMIIYSKRLCGRKKSLTISRQGEDGATAMEKGAANGRGAESSKSGEEKADVKGSDEWIQLIDKENSEAVPESAEATKLMRRDESGELSDVKVTATTQEQKSKS
ncbi:CD44 antigen-like [Narcine bancroftii]|uniref:CD44 antigen-like n=1 Tax=Narcine bancroftii TaxID=1343680 RepID=UPI0038321B39